jgi:hypothetical protein
MAQHLHLNTTQWLLVGCLMLMVYVAYLIYVFFGPTAYGKREQWMGVVLGALFIPLLLWMAPLWLVIFLVQRLADRQWQKAMLAMVAMFMLIGFVVMVIRLGDPPGGGPGIQVER